MIVICQTTSKPTSYQHINIKFLFVKNVNIKFPCFFVKHLNIKFQSFLLGI